MSVILVGGGGQCKSIIPAILSLHEIAGIVDGEKLIGDEILGIKFKYTDNELEELVKQYDVIITVGITAVANPVGRKKIYERLKQYGANILSVQSKCALVHGVLGESVLVHDLAYVGPNTTIGNNTIVNTGAIVEHDCCIGEHCHISPGAVITGGVTICNGVIIGAGSVVYRDINESGFYAGVPAKKVQLVEVIH